MRILVGAVPKKARRNETLKVYDTADEMFGDL